jgi:hypothetical protein
VLEQLDVGKLCCSLTVATEVVQVQTQTACVVEQPEAYILPRVAETKHQSFPCHCCLVLLCSVFPCHICTALEAWLVSARRSAKRRAFVYESDPPKERNVRMLCNSG